MPASTLGDPDGSQRRNLLVKAGGLWEIPDGGDSNDTYHTAWTESTYAVCWSTYMVPTCTPASVQVQCSIVYLLVHAECRRPVGAICQRPIGWNNQPVDRHDLPRSGLTRPLLATRDDPRHSQVGPLLCTYK